MVGVSTTKEASLAVSKDRGYVFDVGFLFTTPGLSRLIKRRREATISLSIHGRPFDVCVDESNQSYRAVAIKSLVSRRINYADVPVASVLVGPIHPDFRAFRSIGDSGVLALPRDHFTHFDHALDAAFHGRLQYSEARRLFEGIVAITKQFLPEPKPLDTRIERVIALLREDVNRPLEDLAAAIHVSYHRLSHLFAETVGLPLRSYQLWQKMHKAFELWMDGHPSGHIVQAAGLSDVSHFHRVCRDMYGFPPTFFLSEGVELLRAPRRDSVAR